MFTETVLATIDAHGMLPRRTSDNQPRDPVIVGVSGGPDSVALLAVLCDLAGEGHRIAGSRAALAIAPIAAHLNHGLRGDAADADERFVQDLARARGLVCEVGRADVRAEAEAMGVGIEEAARQARRRFLAQAARRHGATKVALAHHADDRAETILFHILRGTGIEGLAALGPRAPLALFDCGGPSSAASTQIGASSSPFTPSPSPAIGRGERHIEIVRPLIDVTRAQVLAHLDAIGQPYCTDDTNASDAYTRNRVRHVLLPLVAREFNPKVEEALVRLGDQAAAAAAVLGDALDGVWRQIVREVPAAPSHRPTSGGPPCVHGGLISAILIDADDFAPLRPWLQGAIIRRAVDRLGGGLKFMSAERTREVVAQLLAKTVAGPVALPGGLVAERRRRTIRLARPSAECGVRSAEHNSSPQGD